MNEELKARVERETSENKVVIYMRGTPQFPRCGFSARAVAVFESLKVPYYAVDLDRDPELWRTLAQINNWPTAPQVYVHGEFIGGCDNTIEALQTGELHERLGLAPGSA